MFYRIVLSIRGTWYYPDFQLRDQDDPAEGPNSLTKYWASVGDSSWVDVTGDHWDVSGYKTMYRKWVNVWMHWMKLIEYG